MCLLAALVGFGIIGAEIITLSPFFMLNGVLPLAILGSNASVSPWCFHDCLQLSLKPYLLL